MKLGMQETRGKVTDMRCQMSLREIGAMITGCLTGQGGRCSKPTKKKIQV